MSKFAIFAHTCSFEKNAVLSFYGCLMFKKSEKTKQTNERDRTYSPKHLETKTTERPSRNDKRFHNYQKKIVVTLNKAKHFAIFKKIISNRELLKSYLLIKSWTVMRIGSIGLTMSKISSCKRWNKNFIVAQSRYIKGISRWSSQVRLLETLFILRFFLNTKVGLIRSPFLSN